MHVISGLADCAAKADAVARRPKADAGSAAGRLVDKLALSGQLRPGTLVRALKRGEIEQFDLGLARMLELSPAGLEGIFYGSDGAGAALACHAAGIDRCVFPTILALSREARGLSASSANQHAIDTAFATPRHVARMRLHASRSLA